MNTNPSNPLAARAMLATLTTGAWRVTKLHKDLSSEINTQHATGDRCKGSVRISDHPAIESLTKLHAAARVEHYRLTVPSCDDGWRFLPCGRELEHSRIMQEYGDRHRALVTDFLRDYADERATAPARLNGLYRPEFFPPEDTVGSKFRFATRYLPVPEAGTWQDWLREAATEGEADVRQRLRAALEAMRDKLANPEAIFRDSLTGNLAEICTLVPDLNLTGAADIATAAQEAADLGNINPQDLRENKTTRADAAAKAARLAAMLA